MGEIPEDERGHDGLTDEERIQQMLQPPALDNWLERAARNEIAALREQVASLREEVERITKEVAFRDFAQARESDIALHHGTYGEISKALSSEISLHAAWVKRATEAERERDSLRAQLKTVLDRETALTFKYDELRARAEKGQKEDSQ